MTISDLIIGFAIGWAFARLTAPGPSNTLIDVPAYDCPSCGVNMGQVRKTRTGYRCPRCGKCKKIEIPV
jgi:ssDNA-binding Zn-finger/Zn-ribbon topoisomerase 1